MSETVIGAKLADEVLARRQTLPRQVAPVTLTGRYVRLEPVNVARDADWLYAISNGQPATLGDRSVDAYDADALVWRYMFGGPYASPEDFVAYLQGQASVADGLCLSVIDQATGRPVGIANYMRNFPEHLTIELGGIWYSPLAQRTHANTEATYLMLGHAFDLGYRRVEWKCDSLNARSRRAALRMGFQYEGMQAAHYIVKGRNRDTTWFRILDREWPTVRPHLEGLLYGTSQ